MNRFILIITLFLSQSVLAQNLTETTVDLDFKNQTILQCLKAIEKTTGFTFSYNLTIIRQEDKRVNQNFNQKKVGQVLDVILANTTLTYREIANQITIYSDQKKLNTVSLSGYIIDKNSHEKIIGAQLYFPSIQTGCVTNAYGFYHINITKGTFEIIISSIGMKKKVETISIDNDIMLNFELEEDILLLNTIEVNANKKDTSQSTDNSTSALEKVEIEPLVLVQTPSSNGLPDVTKYIQNIAGVQPLYDGSSSYTVRNLPNGNNLILLDEIPIYHPNHLLGLYSIVNSNAVKSASLYKDHIPAKFGVRNSSILQIYTKEGNLNKFQASGGLGANVPHLSLEGPIIKNKASFYLSGRRSFNALNAINFWSPTDLPNPDFFDLTLKANYKLDYQNRIYLTSYIGNDRINDTTGVYNWGNKAFSFRWNRVISDKTFTNLTLINSIFNYNVNKSRASSVFGQKVFSSQVKYDVSYFVSNQDKINYGVSILNTRTQSDETENGTIFLSRNNFETAFYASLNRLVNPKLKFEAGLRLPFNFHLGTQDTSLFLQPNQSFQQVIYSLNKAYDFKFSLDPRFLLTYQLDAKNTLEFSQNIATQFIHIINYNTEILPVQIWTTPSKYLKPERNYQTTIALTHRKNYLTLTGALYYRFVNHVIDFAPAIYSEISEFESNLLSGHLHATGLEFMARYQKTKQYSAFVSYDLTYAKQKVNGINNDLYYTATNNRPHYFTFNQYFIRSNKWEFGSNIVVHSKTAITLPTGKFEINGIEYPLYDGTKNTSRLPIHHRLDLSAKRTLGIKKQKNRGYLMMTFTNIYGRGNVSNVYLTNTDENKLNFVSQNYIPQTVYLYYYIKF